MGEDEGPARLMRMQETCRGGSNRRFQTCPPGRHSFSPALGTILSLPSDLSGEQFTIVFW